LTSAELFGVGPPGTWTTILPPNDLRQARRQFTMTRLKHPDDWVLAAGGVDASMTWLKSSELFEPGAGADMFMTNVDMSGVRSAHTATLLQDGRVLILGGRDGTGNASNTAEFYNGGF
jgi:hypothetical protein